jgi:asparagine synthetase B (glutamine-hydrolysing)
MVHTLLAIQGFNPQPYKTNKGYLLFNGEIYGTSKIGELKYNNIPENMSESNFLETYLENNNFSKLDELDGEFVINYIDITNNSLNIITDPFYTKPFCYYRDDDIFIGSSYESCILNTLNILNISINNIIYLKPNIHYMFELSSCKLKNEIEIIKWDFYPKFNDFNRWNNAFENSIKKRINTNKGIFVPLSSGYDSGCIVSALIKLNKKFETYTFKGQEDLTILT